MYYADDRIESALRRKYLFTYFQFEGSPVMPYLIRSTNGVILSDEKQETVFQTKEEAQKQIDFLALHTTEEWKLIPLPEHHNAIE